MTAGFYGPKNSVILYGSSGRDYARKIFDYLQGDASVGRPPINTNLTLGEVESSHFDNGEPNIRIGSNVGERKVYPVQAFYPKDTMPDVPERVRSGMLAQLQDKYGLEDADLVREVFEYTLEVLSGKILDSDFRRVYDAFELLTLNDAAKRASAAKIIDIMTTYPFGRQDRKSVGRQPITAKLFANLIERSGADAVCTMDMHADQIQGFFDIPCDNLNPGFYFIRDILGKFKGFKDVRFKGSDEGSAKKMRRLLTKEARLPELEGVHVGALSKDRDLGNSFADADLTAGIHGKNIVTMDDVIDTGGTLVKTVEGLFSQPKPPDSMTFYATEALLSEPATERIDSIARDHDLEIVTTDVLPHPPGYISERPWMRVIPVHQSFAHFIDQRDQAESVSGILFDGFESFENTMFRQYPASE